MDGVNGSWPRIIWVSGFAYFMPGMEGQNVSRTRDDPVKYGPVGRDETANSSDIIENWTLGRRIGNSVGVVARAEQNELTISESSFEDWKTMSKNVQIEYRINEVLCTLLKHGIKQRDISL